MRKYGKELKKKRLSRRIIAEFSYTRRRSSVRNGGLSENAFWGSVGRRAAPLPENERRLMRENAQVQKANGLLKDALAFLQKAGRSKAGTAI